jgi:hypothetical protein
MPLHMIERDLSEGTLSVLDIDDMPPSGYMLTMSAFHQPAQPPGPAGKWFVNRVKALWHGEGVI